jgi:phosphoadenylylsulfate reductase (thioredoxin) (EC 1.8.4.8)
MVPAMNSLSEKVTAGRAALEGLLTRAEPGRVAVAWTGGKDSTVALALWREVLESRGLGPLRALNLDTGLKFPEIIAFRDRLAGEWGLELTIVRPEVDLSSYPVARDKVACCRDLKIAPLSRALREADIAVLITGLREDEHAARAGLPFLEERADPPHLRANPLADWTEMDIWAHILERGLPYCDLYLQGYRSLGCMPCTHLPTDPADERSGRDQDKERHMAELRSLGYF